ERDENWLARTGSPARAAPLAHPECISIYTTDGGPSLEATIAGRDGRWSRDGERLAYATPDGHPAIWSPDAPFVLLNHVVENRHFREPAWCPEGRFVLWWPADRVSSILVDAETRHVDLLPFGYSTAVFCPLSTAD